MSNSRPFSDNVAMSLSDDDKQWFREQLEAVEARQRSHSAVLRAMDLSTKPWPTA
jgi:hypothetical protein